MITFREHRQTSIPNAMFLRKLQTLRSKVVEVRVQIKMLRFAQHQVDHYIRNAIKSIQDNLKDFVYRHQQQGIRDSNKQNNKFYINSLTRQISKLSNSITHFKQKKNTHFDIKGQDEKLRASILKELKEIKNLEKEETKLRRTNERHTLVRKSISKQQIHSKMNSRISQAFQNGVRIVDSQFEQLDDSNFSHESQIQKRIVIECFEAKRKSVDNSFTEGLRRNGQHSQGKRTVQNSPYFGRLICQNGHQYYRGNLLLHKPNGQGNLNKCCQQMPMKLPSEMIEFVGNFKNGKFDGLGTLFYERGLTFIGQFNEGQRHGEGGMYFKGSSQLGLWERDKLIRSI